MKIVEFRGYEIKVPAGWPVYSLSKDPSQCVRYDKNAVYLGTPGPDQHCPPNLVGTADTVSMGGPAIPGVQVVSAKTGRRARRPGTCARRRTCARGRTCPPRPGRSCRIRGSMNSPSRCRSLPPRSRPPTVRTLA